jgi:hypothetical protein
MGEPLPLSRSTRESQSSAIGGAKRSPRSDASSKRPARPPRPLSEERKERLRSAVKPVHLNCKLGKASLRERETGALGKRRPDLTLNFRCFIL